MAYRLTVTEPVGNQRSYSESLQKGSPGFRREDDQTITIFSIRHTPEFVRNGRTIRPASTIETILGTHPPGSTVV